MPCPNSKTVVQMQQANQTPSCFTIQAAVEITVDTITIIVDTITIIEDEAKIEEVIEEITNNIEVITITIIAETSRNSPKRFGKLPTTFRYPAIGTTKIHTKIYL